MHRTASASHGTPELTLATAAERNPEWRPWIELLRLTLAEIDRRWAVEIAPAPARSDGAPLLDGARLTVSERSAAKFVEALLAAAGGARPAFALFADPTSRVPALPLLEAAVALDRPQIAELAAPTGLDVDALGSVAQLAVMPLLHGCRQRLAERMPQGWSAGYCPLCGGWPAFAEMRGLERERRLRCSRCAADWRFQVLRCPFCLETDHAQLGGLLVEGDEETRRIDICRSCTGYIKGVTTLTALPPARIATEDVATLHLDMAALERGFGRPQELARPVRLTIEPGGSRWRS